MVFCHGSSPCGKYIDKDKIKEKEEERIMKTVIRKFALLLTALTIAVTSSVFVAAQNPSEISLEDFETEYTRLEFMAEAYKQMAEAIKDDAGFTVIYDDIPLYSCYGNIIGYEFAISTDGEEAGYLKLLDYGNGPEFISSSATGVPDYMTYADYIEENSIDGRLYSGSGLWNLIKISDNSFCELGWMDVHSKEAVQDAYARKFAIYNAPEETEDVTVPEATGAAQSEDTEESLEQLYSAVDYSWAILGDFVNVYITNPNGITQTMMGCCSPLAGTNIVRYFRSIGESSLSNSYSNNAILTGMYIAMDTNRYSTATAYTYDGTPRANIQPGFLSFCQSYAAGTPTATVYTAASDLTEAKLKSYLDEGHLILATANDYTGEKTHSFVIVGYNGSAFYVADGINPGVSAFPLEAISPQQIIAISF